MEADADAEPIAEDEDMSAETDAEATTGDS